MQHGYLDFRDQTLHPLNRSETRKSPQPDQAHERWPGSQTDSSLCPGRIWENDTGKPLVKAHSE
jgi:hypothetical protein